MRAGPRRNLRTALLLGVLTACTAPVALPASALAQASNDPDSFYYGRHINEQGSALPTSYSSSAGSTVGAGWQSHLLDPPFTGSGLAENIGCQANGNMKYYGAT